MTKHVATAVIIDNARQKILLQKREDFRVWSFAGGIVEKSEAPDAAAIREAKEETGLDVEIVRHVADFHRPQTDETVHVYESRVIGGEMIKQGYETLDVDWFEINNLPHRLLPDTNRYLDATLKNHPEPLYEKIHYSRWYIILRSTAIRLRNIRNRYLR